MVTFGKTHIPATGWISISFRSLVNGDFRLDFFSQTSLHFHFHRLWAKALEINLSVFAVLLFKTQQNLFRIINRWSFTHFTLGAFAKCPAVPSLLRLEVQPCTGHGRTWAAPAQKGLKQTKNDPDRWKQNVAEKYSLVTAALTASGSCPAWVRTSAEKWVNWWAMTLTTSLLINWYRIYPNSSHTPILLSVFTVSTNIEGKDFPSVSF